MAVTGSLSPTIAISFKAISTLGNETDSVQVAGSVDGEFHGADATTDNIKPLRMDDLGGGYFGQGVALRGTNGALLGVAGSPVIVSQESSEVTVTFSEELPQGNQQIGAVVTVCGRMMDENGNMLPVKMATHTETVELDSGDAFEIVEAAEGCKIRVIDYEISSGEDVSFYFQDGAASQLSQEFLLVRSANKSVTAGAYIFETAEGEDLQIKLSSTVTEPIFSRISYIEVPVPA